MIEPVTSKLAAPIVLDPRNNGFLYFCADSQKLNTVTTRDSHLLPHMDA